MTYRVELHRDVVKFFKKHRDKNLKESFINAVSHLEKNPRNAQSLDIKRMQGSENDYRLRIGKYPISL